MSALPEVWLRGPLPTIPALLQPVAHALLQAEEEVVELLQNFNEKLLWKQPANLASVGFHLKHIAGVQDRLFTYARNEMLGEQQLLYLGNENNVDEGISLSDLIKNLQYQTARSIEQLSTTGISSLTETRLVGRKQLPSTIIGLMFHAAEHTMRHTGQLLVTVKVLKAALISNINLTGF